MWSDPVADMLTRIRNAVRNRDKQVLIPRSKEKLAICQVLKEEGYVGDIDTIDEANNQGQIRVMLKYGPRGEQVISQLKRASRAGLRKYVGVGEIPKVLNGLGIAVVSTSRGVMSDRKCREFKVGGELVCTVY